jgi:DNA-binding response OmpR family regulator
MPKQIVPISVVLPEGAIMSATSKAEPAVPGPLTGRRILVVEDEYFLADDLHRHFASLGAEIIGPIAYIDDADEILKSDATIDAALLDINVRSEMIFPLARLLRSRRVPFVFTTGYDRSSLGPEFVDVQVWEKPLDIPRVARSLAALISAP